MMRTVMAMMMIVIPVLFLLIQWLMITQLPVMMVMLIKVMMIHWCHGQRTRPDISLHCNC